MKFLDIGEVSEKTGVRPSALRYYEDIGLIESMFRHGLRRQFAPDVLLQIKLITMGQTAGFSLEEIARMFGKSGRQELPRDVLHQKAEEIDRQIKDLAALRDMLRHVAECRAPSHMECPTFRRLVELAGKRRKTRPTGKRPVTKAAL
jgi:DNA-binding transcriptional MerR regulator